MPPDPTILDERSRRRPDFVEGDRILLLDGQPWSFAQPRVRVETIACEAGPLLSPRWFYPGVANPEMSDLFALAVDPQIEAYCRSDPDSLDRSLAMLALAGIALARNYELNAEEVAALLVGPTDRRPDRFRSMWKQIHEAVITRPLEEMTRVGRTIPYLTSSDYLALDAGRN